MADLSLDEFIRKNNVKMHVGNLQQGQAKKRPLQKTLAANRKNGIQQPMRKFDARQRLVTKSVGDARNKIIINKKNGAGDARNKIVQKQVQKGTFDARSVLQRQVRKQHRQRKQGPGNFILNLKGTGGGRINVPLKRTLSNPDAHGKGHIKVTNSGLLVTRPTQNQQVSLYGNSLQVTKKTKPFEGSLVPIIQIRNDRYRQPPAQQPQPKTSLLAPHYPQSSSRQFSYQDYDPSNYSYPDPTYVTSQRTYRDYDDPHYNPASTATPEIPKIQISNVRPLETSGIRPVTYADYSQTRVPPGAATVSQGAKQSMSKTVLQPAKLTPAGMKRKPPAADVSGPLRLGKGGGPGIDLGPSDSSASKRSKLGHAVDEMDVADVDSGVEVISPLQGFRVMVTNLFSGVTQDDIIELFGAVGPLKKAKLLKPGTAEVVYVNRNDALSAQQKYHSRELDGQPMSVKMTTPYAAVVKKAVGDNDPDITGEALRLYKKGSGSGSLPDAPVEIPTIHRALFKAGPPAPNKSVKFTVKI